MTAPKGTGRAVLNVRSVKRTSSRMRSSSFAAASLERPFLAPMGQFSMFPGRDNAAKSPPPHRMRIMPETPISQLRARLSNDQTDPQTVVREALACANQNAGRNTYLWLDPERTLAEAASLPEHFPDRNSRPALYGIPISVKDCFDLTGTRT